MTNHSSSYHDVIIAGAGPVGLLLACELSLAGCSVLVLERAPTPLSPAKTGTLGLRGLTVPTIEALDRRGLLHDLTDLVARERPAANHWQHQSRRPGGHFAGISFFLDQVDQSRWPYRAPVTGALAATMAQIEGVLAARALANGVTLARGVDVAAVEEGPDGVVARTGDGRTYHGSWLVGCDGARSIVRKTAGIAFAGTEPEFTGYSLIAELADPSLLAPGRHRTATGTVVFTPPTTIALVDFDGGAAHGSVPTMEWVEAALRRVSGRPVVVETLTYAATWTDRAFQAPRYRAGRVLLAGDAAHIHSPLGGQGLNLGLGDAFNLGWKLATTIRGTAPADLLDSYERERSPIAAAVLAWSRAQVALMRSDEGSRALDAVMRQLLATTDGATTMAERVWGVTLRLELGSDHPLVGRSAPDLVCADGSRVNELLRDGRGLLIHVGDDGDPADLVAPFADRRHCRVGVKGPTHGLAALLVRPDGIVAWAADTLQDGLSDDGLRRAIDLWFG